MTRIGVRALKDHLSQYLRRAGKGERIIITDRGEPVAALTPVEETDEVRWGWNLVRQGTANWSGGKPGGCENAPVARGKTAAEMVLEDRR